MCTLIALHRCFDEAPLVVAANRDESLDRPAEGPALWFHDRLPVAAPRDLQAGGTWLGLNRAGLLAAITNRSGAERDASRRSRGLLVLDALEASSARQAAESLVQLPRDAYNPFNLMVADGRDAFVVIYEGNARVVALAPGPHVICNADPDADSVPKVGRLLEGTKAALRMGPKNVLDGLGELCRGHEGAGSPLEDACIHADRYGTRSSTLLRLGPGSDPAWWFADGPPCRTTYENCTPLLYELGRQEPLGMEDSIARSLS